MTITKELTRVTIPVPHYRSHNLITRELVSFAVFRENNSFKAIPSISREERTTTGLPAELEFVYFNYCIASANDMEEETLDVIKQIILELEGQDLI